MNSAAAGCLQAALGMQLEAAPSRQPEQPKQQAVVDSQLLQEYSRSLQALPSSEGECGNCSTANEIHRAVRQELSWLAGRVDSCSHGITMQSCSSEGVAVVLMNHWLPTRRRMPQLHSGECRRCIAR